MTAVSQRISNFLGGVSQQADEKMFPGQVKDALNCYPDTTLGMIKRPGGKFLGKLENLTANTADSAAWFSLFRDNQEKYTATVQPFGIATVTRAGTAVTGAATYSNISGTTSGAGSGALFNVSYINNVYTVSVAAQGTKYATGDTITIPGTSLGGASPANNLTITVATVNGLRVWDLLSGKAGAVTYPAGKQASIEKYLAFGDYRSIKTLTINDFTYIVNTEKTITAKAAPSWNAKRQATIVVNAVEYDTVYKVTINGTDYTYTSGSVSSTPPPVPIKLSDITNGLSAAITSNYTTKTIIDNTIYLTHTSDINVSASAGLSGKDLRAFQDSVDTFNRLPEQAKHNQVVKINNSTAEKDDYYLRFVAEDGVSGKGYWEETIAPNVSTGINEETMPVALIRTSTSPLSFRATFLDGSETVNGLSLQWEPRLVGDDLSNTHPTFVNNKIQDVFLFNNRLGFLTNDNVSMSQAGDYYNFYHTSATTQTAADPIDLSCASIKPAVIRSVVPITQGLLLFSDSQQFLMEAADGAWTPASVSIRTIANYECDRHLKPVDLGSTVMFVSKNQNWARTFEIFTRGQREAPTVNESSKVVPEWIPQAITQTSGSPQNGLWIGSNRGAEYLYMFRYYDQGDERVMASWVRWGLPANVILTAIQNDVLYLLTTGTEGYIISEHKLVLAPSTGGLLNSSGREVDPYLDAWCEVTDATMLSPLPPTAPSYSSTTSNTKVYLPTYFNTGKTLRYVIGLLKSGSPGTESGYTNVATLLSDGGGTYFNVPGDVTGNYIYVGYEYEMELTLPKYYYSLGEQGSDFTANTTTARMSFYTGLGGDIYFSLKDRSRSDWLNVSGTQLADFYLSGSSPFRDSYVYKVPIHQRPDNYTMKVTSNTPFPVSLVAMQWEGQYSPGFYRRS